MQHVTNPHIERNLKGERFRGHLNCWAAYNDEATKKLLSWNSVSSAILSTYCTYHIFRDELPTVVHWTHRLNRPMYC